MDYQYIAQNFVQSYYGTLDKADLRPNLANVYRDTTQLVFEGQQFTGGQAIMEKLMQLPKSMARAYSSVDAIPLDGYLLVNVMGQQKCDDDPPLAFTHTFILSQEGTNIVIVKEIFRIVLHDF